MNAQTGQEEQPEFVEVDPTGRYGRYGEILGKGSSKTVYRAFDEYEGIEVAWNQVKLHDFLQSPEELERLYCEIHLLKTLKHKNIMKFYTSWVDTSNRNINFVTEMFTSGTLRQYRQKHRRVHIRAVKNWCRQILSGLLYLHSHDPPIIHRDLKCDNIFINGNQGQVKIGDLGLAAILRKSHADHCVGTPEFMAPEVYEEQYNELVDIYAFGMCILEMVTFEYPYSECTHPAQIYKKVISRKKPEALYKVQDPEVRQFVEKCLATVSQRLPARELLKDPFLQTDDASPSVRDDMIYELDPIMNHELGPVLRQPHLSPRTSNGYLTRNRFTDDILENGWEYDNLETSRNRIELFGDHEDVQLPCLDITIKGNRKDDGSINLKLRISDKEGRRRYIHFPFDIESDSALSVATEMVGELDLVDFDVMNIAEMIDGEVCTMVPEWRPGPGFEELPGPPNAPNFQRCASAVSSYDSLTDIFSVKNTAGNNLRRLQQVGGVHGRFAEVSYQLAGSEQHPLEGFLLPSSRPDNISGEQVGGGGVALEAEEMSMVEKVVDDIHDATPLTCEVMEESCCYLNSKQITETCETRYLQYMPMVVGDQEDEVQQELRRLKAKYPMQSSDYRNHHVDGTRRASSPSMAYGPKNLCISNVEKLKSLNLQKGGSSRFPTNSTEPSHSNMESRGKVDLAVDDKCVYDTKNFYSCNLLHGCLPRTKSLPVDAVDS